MRGNIRFFFRKNGFWCKKLCNKYTVWRTYQNCNRLKRHNKPCGDLFLENFTIEINITGQYGDNINTP